jgi:hypothetical protein
VPIDSIPRGCAFDDPQACGNCHSASLRHGTIDKLRSLAAQRVVLAVAIGQSVPRPLIRMNLDVSE